MAPASSTARRPERYGALRPVSMGHARTHARAACGMRVGSVRPLRTQVA